jgi:VCBS repeat-containing protein
VESLASDPDLTDNLALGAAATLPLFAQDDAIVGEEDMLIAGTVLANDLQIPGRAFTAALAAAPQHGTLTLDPDGGFAYQPDADFAGSDSFDYVLSDGMGASATATVTITVTPVNDAPTALLLSAASVAEDAAAGAIIGTLSATDPDAGESFAFSLIDDAGGRFAILGDALVLAAPLDFEAAPQHAITLRVTDAGGLFLDRTLAIAVEDVPGQRSVGSARADLMMPGSGPAGRGRPTEESDRVLGRGGDDTIRAGGGDDIVLGGAGADDLSGDAGDDSLAGGTEADTMAGGAGDDALFGEAGDDSLSGDAGKDSLIGGDGADSLAGGAEADALRGGDGNDALDGGAADDLLAGEAGADTLRGDAGADLLRGGEGDDLLAGGEGADTLHGGPGADRFLWTSPEEGGDALMVFHRAEDLLVFAAAGFGGLPAGALAADHFAQDLPDAAMPQFVYARATGVLAWDADGSGEGAAIVIATLSNRPALGAEDVLILG